MTEKILRGRFMAFEPGHYNLGHPTWNVVSVRGGFRMGQVEWSNQWRTYAFRPHPEAVFNRECLAEIHAFLKDQRVESAPFNWRMIFSFKSARA